MSKEHSSVYHEPASDELAVRNTPLFITSLLLMSRL